MFFSSYILLGFENHGDIDGSADQWANESSLLAQQVLTNVRPGAKLQHDYLEDNWSTVRQQLRLAGLRLAAILNETLDDL